MKRMRYRVNGAYGLCFLTNNNNNNKNNNNNNNENNAIYLQLGRRIASKC